MATGQPLPGQPVSGTEAGEDYGAVYTGLGGKPPIFVDPPPYEPPAPVGASISADGSTVAWMGVNVGGQARMLSGESPRLAYAEPLWRRIADGPSASVRRITGGSDPANPSCVASGEAVLPGTPSASDPCQGPFAATQDGRLGVFLGGAGDVIPRLSGDGYKAVFLANAPLVSLGEDFGVAEAKSDLYLVDMREGLTRTQALRPLTQLAGGDQSDIAENGPIKDLGISADGHHVAFTTQRTQFPLGSPAYVSAPAGAPGMLELFDVDLLNDTLTRVSDGFEGGPSEHPHEATASGVDPYTRGGDGALSPSFSSSGSVVSFSDTASNLAFGDGNTPPLNEDRFDGSDAFIVSRVIFNPTLTPQSISSPPAGPALTPPWSLGVTARSRADGSVLLYASVPGVGTLSAGAQSAVRVRTKRRGHASTTVATRSVATTKKAARAAGGGLLTVVLTLAPRYRSLAAKRPGLQGTVKLVFTASGHRPLRQSITVSFLRTPEVKIEVQGEALAASVQPRSGFPSGPLTESRRTMTRSRIRPALIMAVLVMAVLAGLGVGPLASGALALESEGGVSWRLEQPQPPEPPPGVQGSSTPIGLGKVGDIEFFSPNRGLLITPGNGNAVSPGLWAYNGERWHQLSTVCGATDGRIAWAGPEEFWTISDGRPGQAANPKTGQPAPLLDNTLCHFSGGEVVRSYASLAFQASSYQPMHALGCLAPSDCWFAGDPLPELQNGEAFHLHWNGGSLTAEPNPHGHAVESMREFEGSLYESVRLAPGDLAAELETPLPTALHLINRSGLTPTFEPVLGVPLYSSEEFPEALNFLHLGADSEGLWAAAGPVRKPPEHSTPAGVTVVRYSGGGWTQVLGPGKPAGSAINEDVVNSIAPEPGTDAAWVALDTQDDAQSPSPTSSALIAHVSADGTVETQTLPSEDEAAQGIGPKGAAKEIVCPALHDCWMTTTQGWLFHLAPEGERQLPLDGSSAFSHLITFRPQDEGVPQLVPDAPPPDTSGLVESQASKGGLIELPEPPESKVRAALLSNIHTRLVHKTTLELRFHLTVKARVRLLAKRKKRVVASTPMRTSGRRQPQASPAARSPPLADQARSAEPCARPAAARLDSRARQRHGGHGRREPSRRRILRHPRSFRAPFGGRLP